MSIAAATMARVEVQATTVLRRVQAAHRQRVQASSSCPGGCSAPVDAASPKNFGAGIGSAQRPQAREEMRVPAMGVCQSSTGHNLRTENGAHGGWQGNIARMHVAGLGNSSARLLPVPKTANDAAYGRQVDVVMVDTPLRPSLLASPATSPGSANPELDRVAVRSFWPLVLSPSGARVDFGGGGSPPGVWAAARWRAARKRTEFCC